LRGSSDKKINKQNVKQTLKKAQQQKLPGPDQIQIRVGSTDSQARQPAREPKAKEAEQRTTRPIKHPGKKAEALH
jgi:hypothetical protein